MQIRPPGTTSPPPSVGEGLGRGGVSACCRHALQPIRPSGNTESTALTAGGRSPPKSVTARPASLSPTRGGGKKNTLSYETYCASHALRGGVRTGPPARREANGLGKIGVGRADPARKRGADVAPVFAPLRVPQPLATFKSNSINPTAPTLMMTNRILGAPDCRRLAPALVLLPGAAALARDYDRNRAELRLMRQF